MVVVICDWVAHLWVFSSMHASWPVEGAAVLVVPIAGARHDLVFFLSQPISEVLTKANFCRSRWGLAKVVCKTQMVLGHLPKIYNKQTFITLGFKIPQYRCAACLSETVSQSLSAISPVDCWRGMLLWSITRSRVLTLSAELEQTETGGKARFEKVNQFLAWWAAQGICSSRGWKSQ